MFRKFLLSVFAFALLAAAAWARTTDTGKPTKDIFDASINPGDNITWVKDTVYILREQVYVESGATLNINAGTIVKGQPPIGANDTSALIITRGGRIFAIGTKADPIIFTSTLDSVDSQTDLPVDVQELWGGVLIGGQANVSDGPDRRDNMEGLPVDPRNEYGAPGGDTLQINNADNSGTLRYVSIRHGGVDFSATNEVNGLTLCGVGSGTSIEFVEVFSNGDDGFEWFGGTVNSKHLVSSYNEDDQFDWDEGYKGNNQFWFSYQAPTLTNSNNAMELDGAENPVTFEPFAEPNVYNTTFIGAGLGAATADNDRWAIFRDNSGGYFRNSIVTEFDERVMEIPTTNTLPVIGTDLIITDNIFWRFGCNGGAVGALVDTPTCVIGRGPANTGLSAYLAANNLEVNPLLTAFNWPLVYGARVLDPRPQAASPAGSGYPDPSLSDPFFTSVTFAGAFDDTTGNQDANWLCGWTALAQYGFLTAVRGDLDGNGSFSPADVVTQLQVVFTGLSKDFCQADTNCDGLLTPSDVVNELLLVFNGVPLPCV